MRALRRGATAVMLGALSLPASAHADTMEACIRPSERGQVHRDAHRFLEARADFLLCARDVCPAALQRECVKWLDELRARMPSVSISARDAEGHDVVDVRVLVDGKPFVDRLDGSAVALDPGEHVFRYEVRGAAPIEERVLVREGEANRLLTVHVPSASAPAADVSAHETEREEAPSRPVPLASLVLGGVAVLGAGTFGFFAGTAKSDLDRLRDTCGPTQSCSDSAVGGVRRDLLVANVALGIGVVALVAAAWIFLQRPEVRGPKAHASRP